jgi:hypothetical protein
MRHQPGTFAAVPVAFTLMAILVGCSGSTGGKVDSSFIHLPGAGGTEDAPRMTWTETNIDLGLVAAGESRELAYELTNTGGSPLIVTQVLPSCGCAIAEPWDASPLAPGQSTRILFRFEAGESTRTLSESATVVTNAIPASVELRFTAQVLGPDRIPDPES